MAITDGFSDLFGSFDMSVIIDKIYFYVGILLFGLVIGGGIFAILYFRRKKTRDQELYKIGWWAEDAMKLVPTRMDDAEEIVIPGTTLRVFYVKARDLWLPRFTKGITKDLFYVAMTPNRRMVNFILTTLDATLKKANLEIDHTDMLWAAENTREWIKRNYKDKSIKWWQAYREIISNAIHILLHTFSLVIIIYMLRGFVQDLSGVAGTLSKAVETSCQRAFESGVVQG